MFRSVRCYCRRGSHESRQVLCTCRFFIHSSSFEILNKRYAMCMQVRSIALGILIGGVVFSALSVVIAWTGPASAPPNGNVAAPINIGTTDQVKSGGISVDALAVFGSAVLSGTSRYLNFGTTIGSTGYGFRDNVGMMEFKNSGGTWASISSAAFTAIQNYFSTGSMNTIQQIRFSDGTTQTTAAETSSPATTYVTCTAVNNGAVCITGACPAGYVRSGCSAYPSSVTQNVMARPSGNACECRQGANGTGTLTCYAYCTR